MRLRHFLLYIILIPTLWNTATAQGTQELWYTKPATRWTDALPIGNGKLGAMIFGDPAQEHIQFNEATLWTGGPRDYNRADAVRYLPEIRQLLFDGKQKEAEALAEAHFMGRKDNEEHYETQKTAWLARVRQDVTLLNENILDGRWQTMKLPTASGWEAAGLEGLDGAVWFRTSFELSAALVGKDLVLSLGRIRDADFTYFNGTAVGNTEGTESRTYTVPARLLRAGRNEIAVQVINYYDKGGFTGGRRDEPAFIIYPKGGTPEQGIALAKDWQYKIQDAQAPVFPRYQADYQPFGDVWLSVTNNGNVTDYRRGLDITKALSYVTYTAGGVHYSREYFASAPHEAIVMHLAADKPGSITLDAAFKSPHILSSVRKVDDHTLALSVQVRNGVLRGESYLHVEAKQGKVEVTDNGIHVQGANDVTFYLTAGTSFRNYKDVTGNPREVCEMAQRKHGHKSYQAIKAAHIREYTSFFNTFFLNTGVSSADNLPTDERIRNFNKSPDPSLVTLFVQYGRYLLISSSRPGTGVANLQGIWNDLLTPPWGSKYTTNINAEMNYWPAEVLNLSACHEPFFTFIEEIAEAGHGTATAYYGAPGWVLHHNTDLWRGTAPINASDHGIWVTGGAWLCQHLWEHYLFTKDEAFLRKRAYPLMKSASEFFVHNLVKDPVTGLLISTPSNSPEQGGLVAGPTMDHQIIRDLFKNTAAAAEVLKTDEGFRQTLQEKYSRIAPNKIGHHGQLQEWLTDVDDPNNQHRHVSHLWGVYPGTDITWDTSPDQMRAARQSLIFRGDGGTGWSVAWKINLWARFKDGDHAMRMVNTLLSPAERETGKEAGGVYRNLFDAHPPFQIDGNFGGAAGIAEMLVQSHSTYIDLLPALPSALPTGEVRGIRARGGYELSMRWHDGALQDVTVTSHVGGECVLRYGDREVRVTTKKGKKYSFNATLEAL